MYCLERLLHTTVSNQRATGPELILLNVIVVVVFFSIFSYLYFDYVISIEYIVVLVFCIVIEISNQVDSLYYCEIRYVIV